MANSNENLANKMGLVKRDQGVVEPLADVDPHPGYITTLKITAADVRTRNLQRKTNLTLK